MEFLRTTFHDELNGEGEIQIAGAVFQRSRILAELEPDAYEVTFGEWLDSRRVRMGERATEIVSFYKQADRFKALKRTFRGGNLVPFIGAGMSMPCGYPGWTRFLWLLQERSSISAMQLETLIQNGDYQTAAQILHDNLGAASFDEKLQSTYEKPSVLNGPVQYLPYMFTGHVITTNFDYVLEDLFKGFGQGFDHIVLGKALGEVPRLAADGGRLLVKIHGTCNQVADRVLLQTEYKAAYANAGNVQQFFQGFIFARPLVFLGCSLLADWTISEMANVVTAVGHHKLPRHYAILEDVSSTDRNQRERDLAKANIFPIWYPKGEHDQSIEPLLVALMEDT